METRYREPKQLEGDDLTRARGMAEDSGAALQTFARFVVDQVYGDEKPADARLKFASVTFGNDTKVFTDGESFCGVYQDPPGVCRECTQEEWDLAHQAAQKAQGVPI
jgi:hypothetical protein